MTISRTGPLLPPKVAGYTLVELLIYCLFSVVILAIVGGMLISSLAVEHEVRGLTETSSLGQLISRSVEEGARNASDIRAEPSVAAGQLLRARVASGTSAGSVTWECQAWYYSTATNGFYWAKSATAAIPTPLAGTDMHAAPWLFLGDGVEPDSDTGAFFGSDGSNVILRFKVSSESVDLVLIPNTVVKRQAAAGGTGPTTCF
jgi:type II secretory pathway pseudopilin PulG